MRFLIPFLLLFGQSVFAQQEVIKVHSHNDYNRTKPFWEAYNGGASSIEVDVFLKNDTLFVAHDKDEIIQERTIKKMYFEPLKKIASLPRDSQQTLQLLIDIKSDAIPTLDKLVRVLQSYKVLRDSNFITLVISGNRPLISEYTNYPDYILFDYQQLSDIKDPLSWKKIALISLPFYKHSKWDGKSRLTGLEYRKIRSVIEKAHLLGKPFRFWAIPDTELTWEVFSRMGIDFVNTDNPAECFEFLASQKKERQ